METGKRPFLTKNHSKTHNEDGMKSLKISLFLIDQDSRATAAARRCCRLCPWATWQGFFPSKLIKGDSDVSESCSGKC